MMTLNDRFDEKVITPWKYQENLVEDCVENDAIVILPTGSGKTLIATMLMDKLILRKKGSCAFIVNKGINLEQQHQYITQHLPKYKVDKWKGSISKHLDDFVNFMRNNEVVILTSQDFMEALTRGLTSFDDFALIVIDECQHCLTNLHNCRLIVEQIKAYKRIKNSQFPRFLGLTACGLNGKVAPHQLPQGFMQLEVTLGAKIVTSNEYLKGGYGNDVKEVVFFTEDYESNISFDSLDKLEKFCLLFGESNTIHGHDPRKRIKEHGRRIRNIIDDCGLYCGYVVIKHDTLPYINNAIKELNSEGTLQLLLSARTIFEGLLSEMENILQNVDTFDQILPHVHPRITKLLEVFRSFDEYQNKIGGKCCAIVFTEKCDTAMVISMLIRQLGKLRQMSMNTAYAIGTGSQKLKFSDIDAENMNGNLSETLDSFKRGEINCLISTPILEEGIDLSMCNLVICTKMSSNFCSYLQSRGRARHSSSMFAYIISPEDRAKYIYNIHVFKSNEKFLLENIAKFEESLSDHKKIFYDIHHDSCEKPYIAPATGAKLTVSTATYILNVYCSKLPSDIYTPLSAKRRVSQQGGWYVCEIELPPNCPILDKKISGPGKMSSKDACMYAAFEACKILHAKKELDDRFLPYSKEAYAKKENFSVDLDTGTTKKHRLYDRKVADVLRNDHVRANVPFSVYLIEMELAFTVSEELNIKRRKVMNPIKDTPYIFGLCATKWNGGVASFPVFEKHSKQMVSLKLASNKFVVNSNQLELLKKFHSYAFENILGLRTNADFQPDCDVFSTLVIPLKRSSHIYQQYEIDYDVAQKTLLGFSSIPTEDALKTFVYDPRQYENAIVKPCYRDDDLYYVEEYNTETFLNSRISETNNSTFEAYYRKSYNLIAYQQNQKLLDVTKVSKQLNCLFPPHTSSRKRNVRSEREYLVPEFVLVHPMPASLWLMMLKIPSVLYRINYLLLSNELRMDVLNARMGNKIGYSNAYKWADLNYSFEGLYRKNLFEEDVQMRSVDSTLTSSSEDSDSVDLEEENCFVDYANSTNFDLSFTDEILPSSSDISNYAITFNNGQQKSGMLELELNSYYGSEDTKNRLTAPTLSENLKVWSNIFTSEECSVQPALLLQALTTTGACDGFNLERLETMGDSFLKLTTTLYFFDHYPDQHEGLLTSLRSYQICNANLLKLGFQKGIPTLMVSSLFDPKLNWMPPCYVCRENSVVSNNNKTLPQEISADKPYNKMKKQMLSDKSVADCVEALIGAHLTLGENCALDFMEWLGLNIERNPKIISPFDRLTEKHKIEEVQRYVIAQYENKDFEKLEHTIGYTFRNRSFLVQAFIHLSSFSKLGCYQRLEYLGDAVLDFLITQHLYKHNAKFSPGVLTDLRSALVNNINFASLAVKYGLHELIVAQNEMLNKSITKFALLFKQKGDLNFNDMMQLITENDAQEVTVEEIEVPKALGDIFESLAGAVYLDCGMDIEVVWQVFYNLMKGVIEKCCENPPINPIRELYENHREKFSHFEKGEKVDGKTCLYLKVGKEKICGLGKSERHAKRNAAIAALNHFKVLDQL